MTEATLAAKWLYSVLTGDAVLTSLVGTRVHDDIALRGPVSPWVIFNYQSGHDVRGLGPARIMVDTTYQVKAVGQYEGYGPLETVADRIDALLQGASGSVAGGYVLMCVRQSAVKYPEVNNGMQYRHLGGLYRIVVR